MLALAAVAAECWRAKRKDRREEDQSGERMVSEQRIVSLDALRGFTIVGMIIVNSPGSWSHVYAPLLHASWHGLTPTDLVFPFFLFIVGVSIALAYGKRLEVGGDRKQLYRKILSRAAKIFALGLFLNLWPNFGWGELRVAGVLQRIAVVFLVCALVFLNTNWKQQFGLAMGILIGYWALLSWVPVPLDSVNASALETGVVERARSVANVDVEAYSERALAPNYEPGTNFAAWLDRRLLPGRFWERSWDPEGLVSTLPAIATGIFGMLIGVLTRGIGEPYRRVSWLFMAGFLAFVVGVIWSWGFPLNKNLWSSSFVLVTGGLASMAFAACIMIVDTLGYRRWTKVGVVFGANAVVTYALSGMLLVVFYGGGWGVPSLAAAFMGATTGIGIPAKLASLCYALLYVAVLYIPAYWLWRKRIFVRL